MEKKTRIKKSKIQIDKKIEGRKEKTEKTVRHKGWIN